MISSTFYNMAHIVLESNFNPRPPKHKEGPGGWLQFPVIFSNNILRIVSQMCMENWGLPYG